jgi:hypothetical protein
VDSPKLPEGKETNVEEASETKTPRRTRSARRKTPHRREEEQETNEDSPKMPAKKRARKKTSGKQTKPEQEAAEAEGSTATPAERRTRRKAPPKEAKPGEDENEESLTTPAKKRSRVGYSTRVSARKRIRTAATPMLPEVEQVRVIMTGVDATAKHRKVSEALLCMLMNVRYLVVSLSSTALIPVDDCFD